MTLLLDRATRETFLLAFKVAVCFSSFAIMMPTYFCGEPGHLDLPLAWYYVLGDYDDSHVCNIITCVAPELLTSSGEVGEKRGGTQGVFSA